MSFLASWHSMYFNTSHVYINHTDGTDRERKVKISIHLMFILIADRKSTRRDHHFISIHLMFILITHFQADLKVRYWNFNTSHVYINLCIDNQYL